MQKNEQKIELVQWFFISSSCLGVDRNISGDNFWVFSILNVGLQNLAAKILAAKILKIFSER